MIILSIGVVALNEEKFLPKLLESILSQTYDLSRIEVLLIDSKSSDNTKKIMNDFQKQYKAEFYDIKVLDNERKIQSAGWNVAIDNFSGDALSRIDAHSIIDKDFCKYVVENLESGEMVVGGKRPALIEKNSQWAKSLLQIENSLFGSSILKSRSSDTKMYVKTMFHATYRREVLTKVGHFNEKLLRTEDNEYHYRISKSGYRLCYDPKILSYQYARSSFKKMLKQKYGNGMWIGITSKKCIKCLSLYHFIPFLFVASIVATTVLAFFGMWYLPIVLWGLYFLFAIINTIFCGARKGFTIYHFFMPILFLILHVSYGTGTFVGFLRFK